MVTAGSEMRGTLGMDSFIQIRDDHRYYVDKTAMIDKVLSGSSTVYLFTRPRRFGKSVNLSMLNAYLNRNYAKDPDRFAGLRISDLRPDDPEKNSNIVVYLNLFNLDEKDFGKFIARLKRRMSDLYGDFRFILDSEEFDETDKENFLSVRTRRVDDSGLESSLHDLCKLIHKATGKKVVLLIDEYDSAVNDARNGSVRKEVLDFYTGFLGDALKYNECVKLAVVTGVMQIAKASIFSKLNNLCIDSVFTSKFDEYFGFTEEEVRTICTDYGHPEKFEEAKEWYDGYRFGNIDVYNPWSIIHYAADDFKPSAYWINTGSNILLEDLYRTASSTDASALVKLLPGGSINTALRTSMSYDEIQADDVSLFSLMVISGYLKAVPSQNNRYSVSFPNKEVGRMMAETIKLKLGPSERKDAQKLCNAVLHGDATEAERVFKDILQRGSYFNLKDESSYTLLLMAFMDGISGFYETRTEIEEGNGRVDLIMKSIRQGYDDMIFEVKVSGSEDDLDKDAAAAMAQIHDRRYYLGMKGTVRLYGVACWIKVPRFVTETLVLRCGHFMNDERHRPCMRIVITGTVQGVGFRPAVYRAAVRAGASGTVRNDGSCVTIDTDKGEELLEELLPDLPPLARIDGIEKEDVPYSGPSGFFIIPSEGTGSGASIPADSAVCDRCVREMMSPGRRHLYPFTTCTDCGPRFTLLRGIPYDRRNTSMDAFPMCPECGREFSSPGDRRFHHQTIACPSCGPSYRLETPDGTFTDDPIGRLAGILDSGGRAVVKGWGGTHICCTTDLIPELRGWYGREQKPFAVMARDMDALRRFADPTEDEERMLLSPGRPIVLCRKVPSDEAEAASPGLDNIGVFLPYTGMHHILFSRLEHDALVMTSANPPGEPMAVDDDDARRIPVDAWLLHDQSILNRADDTVLRMLGDRTQYIRRSRGSVPYRIGIGSDVQAVALGAQENLTGSVLADGRIWPTQHIGNGEKIGVPEFLEDAVRTQMRLVGCEPQTVVMDLHPGYSNRRFGRRLAEEYNAGIIEVQHHWAHAASLMADNSVDRCTVLALDGTGHGDDGAAWGGEVLDATYSGYRRAAHLQYIPLLGSEKAVYDIRRLTFAIDSMNGTENNDFCDRDAAVLTKLMGRSVMTSSMGRILDALSCRLGVCSKRTYDGEPAMKLEPLLDRGHLIDGYEARSVGGVVQTAELFARIDPEDKKEDAAYSIVHGIIGELVALACEGSDGPIGLTGGVSCNGAIARMFEDTVIRAGRVPILHRNVPNGDGGISVGQAAIAARRET